MGILKFIPLILKGKSVANIYEEETGQGKPWFLSRRFFGAIITFIGAAAGIYFGVNITLDEGMVNVLTDNIEGAVAAGIGIYGVILHVIGWVKRHRV